MQPGFCALKCRLPSPALHRRVVLVSGARRCERLLWGPWRPGSTQARQLAQKPTSLIYIFVAILLRLPET